MPNQRLPQAAKDLRAFTLLELIVVVTIIAILAGVFLPRLFGQNARAAEAEAIAVQQLVTAAAERASLVGGQRLAIEFSVEDGVTKLAVMGRSDPEAAASNSNKKKASAWKQDLLVDPVVLEHLELKQALVDGRRLDARGWLMPFGGAQVRPVVALVLGPRDSGVPTAYRIDLSADATAATRTGLAADQLGVAGTRAVQSGPQSRSVDLDATGQGDSPW